MLGLAAALSATAEQDTELDQQIKTIAAAHHGHVALYAHNLRTGQTGSLLLDEPEMALSVSNQRRILKMLMELVDQRGFRIVCATHSQVLVDAPETYVINLDNHVNRNVAMETLGVEGASTIQ